MADSGGNLLKRISILVITLCILVFACAPENQDEYEPVSFDVNQELLKEAPILRQLPFSMQTPLDMQDADSLDVANVNASMAADTNAFTKLELRRLSQSQAGSVIMISQLLNPRDTNMIFTDDYLERLKESFHTNSVHRDKLSINGIRTLQFIITSPEYVTFKLFLLFEKAVFQIDYFIPGNLYEAQIEHVQSTIGSILPKHTKE